MYRWTRWHRQPTQSTITVKVFSGLYLVCFMDVVFPVSVLCPSLSSVFPTYNQSHLHHVCFPLPPYVFKLHFASLLFKIIFSFLSAFQQFLCVSLITFALVICTFELCLVFLICLPHFQSTCGPTLRWLKRLEIFPMSWSVLLESNCSEPS